VSYQTIALRKSGNESYSESHRATPSRRSRPFQAGLAGSVLSRHLNARLKRNVPRGAAAPSHVAGANQVASRRVTLRMRASSSWLRGILDRIGAGGACHIIGKFKPVALGEIHVAGDSE
jgi:hypothetical protein